MPTPKPGRPVRGSTTGRAIMALLDLLGRRWQLRIIWELRGGALGFRDIQKRCDGMSPSVLSQRLAELIEAGVVAQLDSQEYELTELGQKLRMALAPLHEWSDEWEASLAARTS